MASDIQFDGLRAFLTEVGNRYERPAELYLLGGAALLLLGRQRPTVDIDYFGSDTDKTELQQIIDLVASDLGLDVDAVPLDDFVPLDSEVKTRHLLTNKYHHLSVYVFDPYTICLSKLDRGFNTDIHDIVYMVDNGYVDVNKLAKLVEHMLAASFGFDIDPELCRRNLQIVISLASQ